MSTKRKMKQSSPDNSLESASAHSDSDDGGGGGGGSSTQSSKDSKKTHQSRSSASLCTSLGINDVELEWTDADYQNLTSFNIFVRMIRPQLAAANSKLAPSVMTQVLEAKWKEFQDSNPFKKKSDSKIQESEQEAEQEAEKEEESSTECEDDDDNGNDDNDNNSDCPKPEESDDDSNSEFQKAAKSKKLAPQGLRIKLSLKPKRNTKDQEVVRKSSREHKASKKSEITDKEFAKMLELEGDSELDDGNKDRKRKKRKPNSDSDGYGDSDGNRKRQTRKKRAKKEKSESEADEISGSDEESFEQRKKKIEKKRKKVSQDSDNDDDSSQHASGSENSDDSYDSHGRKSKKKKKRPVIPGERKSSRSRKGNAPLQELTDREFERLLEEEVKQKQKKKKAGKDDSRIFGRKPHKKASHNDGESDDSQNEKKEKRHSRKGDKQDGESGNESDHYWYCELCKDGGDLLLCDTCPKSFHKECLKLEIVPDGEWSCPVCTGEGLPEKGDSSEEDNHETFCRVCKDGGDVILCDFCPLVYHMGCLNPPLKSLPDGDWKCPICIIKANPPKGKVKQVLTWRWTHQPKDTDELDHTHSPQKEISENGETKPTKKRKRNPERELFVKFEYHSYWDCAWIPEVELEIFQQISWGGFKKRFDLNEPPALEDGSSFGRPRHKSSMSEDDPHNLEERFYRYGIKPEWLQIHRIVTHDGKGKDRRYLVKWRDLPYSECTWETLEDVPTGLEYFDKNVETYWNRRKLKKKKVPTATLR